MCNTERRMTNGRIAVDITEDDNNVYLAEWVIPKGRTKADGEKRRAIVWEMYAIWREENPKGKRYNKSIKDYIEVTAEISVDETAAHAYKNYKNVVAFYCLDSILTTAIKVGNPSNPNSQRQKKFFKGGYIQVMNSQIAAQPYFGKVNLVIGVTKKKEKTMYSVTSIDIDTKKQ